MEVQAFRKSYGIPYRGTLRKSWLRKKTSGTHWARRKSDTAAGFGLFWVADLPRMSWQKTQRVVTGEVEELDMKDEELLEISGLDRQMIQDRCQHVRRSERHNSLSQRIT
ncbi:hypothetical protein E4U56_005910 [Claviceps arundinis]|uniref:Uncharacterized protein n=1 Tax=Claviceps arundinis TaxID=1623583 RepID=A0A9P7MLF2_9HYPO|nr:hypothetical protein E4U56_005910 [Claviceps arundinis]